MNITQGNAANNNQLLELQEIIKTKDEEIKILWNVIKEINKTKGSDKVSMEHLKHVISSKFNSNHSNNNNNIGEHINY
jgi:hypothetical protein